jgi:hypothetical protein
MNPNSFENFLATPIVIYPEMDETEFAYEFRRMIGRADATAAFVDGEIDEEDWFEILAENGTSIDDALCDWAEGISYMG